MHDSIAPLLSIFFLSQHVRNAKKKRTKSSQETLLVYYIHKNYKHTINIYVFHIYYILLTIATRPWYCLYFTYSTPNAAGST